MKHLSVAALIALIAMGGCRWIASYEASEPFLTDGADAKTDTTPDLGVDLGTDVLTDTGSDVLPDQTPDTSSDTLPDLQSDTIPPDTITPDTQPPCPGQTKGGPIKLSCTPTSVGNCKNGSTITVTIPYSNAVKFSASPVQTGGQPIGIGILKPDKGPLTCNGSLVLKWTLPGQLGGDTTQLYLTVTLTGLGAGNTHTVGVSVITVK